MGQKFYRDVVRWVHEAGGVVTRVDQGKHIKIDWSVGGVPQPRIVCSISPHVGKDMTAATRSLIRRAAQNSRREAAVDRHLPRDRVAAR